MNEIEPAGHRVLVLPDKIKEKTDGGLFIPEQTRDREQKAAQMGTVIAVGVQAWEGFGSGEPWAAVGDRVFFARYGGVEVDASDGRKLRLMNDEDILAVIRQ